MPKLEVVKLVRDTYDDDYAYSDYSVWLTDLRTHCSSLRELTSVWHRFKHIDQDEMVAFLIGCPLLKHFRDIDVYDEGFVFRNLFFALRTVPTQPDLMVGITIHFVYGLENLECLEAFVANSGLFTGSITVQTETANNEMLIGKVDEYNSLARSFENMATFSLSIESCKQI
jgi:hypothetical protein